MPKVGPKRCNVEPKIPIKSLKSKMKPEYKKGRKFQTEREVPKEAQKSAVKTNYERKILPKQ